MFNLPNKIAAACGALITAGGVGLALASPAHAYDFTFEVCDGHASEASEGLITEAEAKGAGEP